jgi:Flp pilus assembly protein TadG
MLLRTRTPRSERRGGATLIESVAVMLIFLMLFFGVMEYCLIIFTQQVSINACREGCRFAVVDWQSGTNLEANTYVVVDKYMAGVQNRLKNYTRQLYQSDVNGNNLGATSAETAPFGAYIVVQIDYDYNPILPSLLFLNKSFHVTTRVCMCDEAN